MIGWLPLLVIVAWLVRSASRRRRDADLPRLLAGAEGEGIITANQRDRLLAYADAHHGGFRLDGTMWLAIVAGLFVVAGVSLLVATNWERIGPGLRIAGYLALLLAVGEGAIRFQTATFVWSLTLEMLWFFLPLLGIGLYAQTFQLSGDAIAPWLLWVALTAPLAWSSVHRVVAALHTLVMAIVLFVGDFVVGSAVTTITGGSVGSPGLLTIVGASATATAWLLSLVLLGAIAVQSMRLLPPAHRHHFIGLWAIWTFVVLLVSRPFELHHAGWGVLAAASLATLWFIAVAALDASAEAHGAGLFAWLGILYGLGFAWHADAPATGTGTLAGEAVVVLATLGAIGGIIALPARRLSPFGGWAVAAKASLAAPMLLALVLFVPDVRLVWTVGIAANVLFALIAVGFMWHGSLVRDARQVNLGVVMLIVILITRFFDVFGSMVQSGVGLITGGVLLAGLAWALDRTRRRLIAGTEATP